MICKLRIVLNNVCKIRIPSEHICNSEDLLTVIYPVVINFLNLNFAQSLQYANKEIFSLPDGLFSTCLS
jgi:hypothetical protein